MVIETNLFREFVRIMIRLLHMPPKVKQDSVNNIIVNGLACSKLLLPLLLLPSCRQLKNLLMLGKLSLLLKHDISC